MTLVGALTIATFVVVFGGLILMLLLDRRDRHRQKQHDDAFETECRAFWAKRAERT